MSNSGYKFLLSGGMSRLDEFEGELPSGFDFILTKFRDKFHAEPIINMPINQITQFQLNGTNTDNQYWELYVGNKDLDLYHPDRRSGIDCTRRLSHQSLLGIKRSIRKLRRQLTK